MSASGARKPFSADAAYRSWLSHYGLREDPTYDLRGAFEAGVVPDERGHLVDTFKLPTHPTFSDESKHSSAERPGGRWVDAGGGRWVFEASPWNLKNMPREQLMDYFDRVESGNTIRFPDGSNYIGGSR